MHRHKSPIVSIIVPLHNKACWIQETIESAFAQSLSDWEMIVVENGSSDQGPSVVEKNSDSRIRLLRAPQEIRGPGAARNFGLERATGEWVLFLDADDLIEKDHLENLVHVASQNTDATIVAGGWKAFDQNNRTEMKEVRPAGETGGLLDSAIAASPWVVHATILQRELVEQIGWPEDMDEMLAEDNHFWFTTCLQGIVAYSKSSGALYRQNTQDCRTQTENIAKWFEGVHTAAVKNVDSLKQKTGLQPNQLQSANLMHLYSTLFKQARQKKNLEYTVKSLKHAEFWLARTGSIASNSLPMITRRALGIAWTERLKSIFQSIRFTGR